MAVAIALLWKDVRCEMRNGSILLPLVAQTILVVSLLGLGVAGFVGSAERLRALFHPIVWSVFLLSGALALLRVFESDRKAGVLQSCFIYEKDVVWVFLEKVIFLAGLLLLNHFVAATFLSMMFDVSIASILPEFCVLSILVTTGYSALGALVGAMLFQHALRNVLIPAVFLPLLFPFVLAVTEISVVLAESGSLLQAGNWLTLVFALTFFYLICGVLFFESAVRQ
ncbi:MAG: heme exporter protein CcmB [Bdellovibrionales bacterium]|nr:heme exporter protein CcmB [Bdellovibrionales bacterium]